MSANPGPVLWIFEIWLPVQAGDCYAYRYPSTSGWESSPTSVARHPARHPRIRASKVD
jgi:hypothetical protein